MKKLILITLITLFGLQMQTQAQGTFEIDERTVYSIAEYTTASDKEWIFSCSETFIFQPAITWTDATDTDATIEMWFSYDQGVTYEESTMGAKTLSAATGHIVLQDIYPVNCDYMKLVYTNGSNTAITLTPNVRLTTYK